MRAPLAVLLVVLNGCAGSQTHLRMLEADNALRVEPSSVPGEYVVTCET